MAKLKFSTTFIFMLLSLLLQFHLGKSDIKLNYYDESCPRAEAIVKEQVSSLYHKKGNIVVAFIRMLFHDCILESCDASLLLDTKRGITSEKTASNSFGLRYFKSIDTIKAALERECPDTVSCADIVALSAREGVSLLGGPNIEMKTGRKDSTKSYASVVDTAIPNQDANMSFVLSTFKSIGVETNGLVALLGGGHTIGRTHCRNFVSRLYPTVDPTLNSKYADYLITHRCKTENSSANDIKYAKNDPKTPMKLDNMYYKNLLDNMGLMRVDQELISDKRTYHFVVKMANDNEYFLDQFSKAMLILSENNPLSEDDGEIRKNCRFVNSKH